MPRTSLAPSGSSKRIISPLPPQLFLPSALPSPYFSTRGRSSTVVSAASNTVGLIARINRNATTVHRLAPHCCPRQTLKLVIAPPFGNDSGEAPLFADRAVGQSSRVGILHG